MIERPTKEYIDQLRAQYPSGTKIRLISMEKDPRPIKPNTEGIVANIDDMGTIHVNWNDGRKLGLIPEVDSFQKI